MAAEVSLEGLGQLKGEVVDGVAHFLGVPFAAPPVGPLRWQPPRPPSPWTGARENPAELPECPQPESPGPTETFPGRRLCSSEDCLVLNVSTPADALPAGAPAEEAGEAARAKLPVVVYIHGGGGKLNSCHSRNFSGQALAGRERICHVATNYRLGVFGFLAHPALSEEDEAAAEHLEPGGECLAGSGNYAMLDLLAALQWVQRHIRSFGGDPDNVTIWGLSSGAQYVCTLVASPPAAGLFHRAMVQSCVDLSNVRKLRGGSDIWLGRSAEDWGVELGSALGCERGSGPEGHRQQLAAMRALSAEKIAQCSYEEEAMDCYEAATDSRWGGASSSGVRSVRPRSSAEAVLRARSFHRVPVLLGYTEEDGLGKMELEHTMFSASDVTTEKGLDALLRREFGEASVQARASYPHTAKFKAGVRRVKSALGDLSKDLWYEAASWCMADALAAAEGAAPVFLYCFTQKVPFPGGGVRRERSFHGADMGFWSGMDGRAGPLGSTMLRYLANFARAGDPNGEGLPEWQPHEPGCGRFLALGPSPGMRRRAADAAERHELVAREYFGRRLPTQDGEPPFEDSPHGRTKRPRTSEPAPTSDCSGGA